MCFEFCMMSVMSFPLWSSMLFECHDLQWAFMYSVMMCGMSGVFRGKGQCW